LFYHFNNIASEEKRSRTLNNKNIKFDLKGQSHEKVYEIMTWNGSFGL
jgi:hypothetical protein